MEFCELFFFDLLLILKFDSLAAHFKQIKQSHFVNEFGRVVWVVNNIFPDFAFLDILLIVFIFLCWLLLPFFMFFFFHFDNLWFWINGHFWDFSEGVTEVNFLAEGCTDLVFEDIENG